MPPGTLTTLWNDDEGFKKTYFSTHPGYYETGDAGYIDEDGYVYVMCRTDDIINVAGHRLSTGEMEGILASHQDVAECAVIGTADELKGQVPLGFLVLKAGVNRPHDEIVKEVIQMVREPDRPGRRLQARRGCGAAAQDPFRQGPPRHDAEDRRSSGLQGPPRDRRRGRPVRDRRGPQRYSAALTSTTGHRDTPSGVAATESFLPIGVGASLLSVVGSRDSDCGPDGPRVIGVSSFFNEKKN